MKVGIKPGVVIKEVNSQFCHVCYSAWFVWKQYGITPTITSANDSHHMEGSLHYQNLAWDFRIWGITDPHKVVEDLSQLLNAKHHDYDVIFERDHVHVEYDVKPLTEKA